MVMNEKEKNVLHLIKQGAYLSQQEMADQLGMSRLALANSISNLIKKGEVIGRAYILPEKNNIIAIGGANVDRKFHIEGTVQFATSNPAHVTQTIGGVARNIAENLGRLGNQVKLLTTIGDDHDGLYLENNSTGYIQLDIVEKLKNEKTGSYSAILDGHGELVIAMADMSIYKQLTPQLVIKHEAVLQKASCIIIDLNCSTETVLFVKSFAELRNIPFVIVPVSSPKMINMPHDLTGVKYFFCNRDEAETYLEKSLETVQDYRDTVYNLLQKGAEHVVLTMGEYGVIAGTNEGIQHFEAVPVGRIIDVTGAGDAFVSAFLHGVLNDETFFEAVQLGLTSAAYTLQAEQTVRTDLTNVELKLWRGL